MAAKQKTLMNRRSAGKRLIAVTCVALLAMGGLSGCDERDNDPDYQRVKIDGRNYRLEIAATPEKRLKGLSGRTEISPSGGMLFVFPRREVQVQTFVMRDCPIDIDIVYLDPSARIVAMHEMKAEEPRGPNEGQPGEINQNYESRLKRYSSRFPAQFVIEIKGGTIPHLNIKEGDRIDLPLEDLKALAR